MTLNKLSRSNSHQRHWMEFYYYHVCYNFINVESKDYRMATQGHARSLVVWYFRHHCSACVLITQETLRIDIGSEIHCKHQRGSQYWQRHFRHPLCDIITVKHCYELQRLNRKWWPTLYNALLHHQQPGYRCSDHELHWCSCVTDSWLTDN